MKSLSTWVCIGIILLAAVVLVVLVSGGNPFDLPKCTMGIAGTTANVTFQGYGAQGFCSNPNGWMFGGIHFYAMSQPQGDELCAGNVTIQDMTEHYTVREAGIFDLTGNRLCVSLGNGAPVSP